MKNSSELIRICTGLTSPMTDFLNSIQPLISSCICLRLSKASIWSLLSPNFLILGQAAIINSDFVIHIQCDLAPGHIRLFENFGVLLVSIFYYQLGNDNSKHFQLENRLIYTCVVRMWGQVIKRVKWLILRSVVGAGKIFSAKSIRFGQIKILHLHKQSISYGYIPPRKLTTFLDDTIVRFEGGVANRPLRGMGAWRNSTETQQSDREGRTNGWTPQNILVADTTMSCSTSAPNWKILLLSQTVRTTTDLYLLAVVTRLVYPFLRNKRISNIPRHWVVFAVLRQNLLML